MQLILINFSQKVGGKSWKTGIYSYIQVISTSFFGQNFQGKFAKATAIYYF